MRFLGYLLMFALIGCQATPEKAASVQILPESAPIPAFPELMDRARNQASFATEAFFVNNWKGLEDAAKSLEQTSRLISKTSDIPENQKKSFIDISTELNQEAVKLKEAASTKNENETTNCLQKIHLKIRQLRISPDA